MQQRRDDSTASPLETGVECRHERLRTRRRSDIQQPTEADIAVSALEAGRHRIDDSGRRWRESAARPRVGRRRVPDRRAGVRIPTRRARFSRPPRARFRNEQRPRRRLRSHRQQVRPPLRPARLRRRQRRAVQFLDSGTVSAALEVGCGTGHWLAEMEATSAERCSRRRRAGGRHVVAGAGREPRARLVRARAEALPWRDATFDLACSCPLNESF